MASRRRGSAASRSRSGSRGTARGSSSQRSSSETSAIKVRKDGKVSVECPQCQASYAIPEAYLDERVKCKHCQTTFVPRVALDKPKRRRGGGGSAATKPILNLALLGIGILIVVIIYNATLDEPQGVKAAPKQLPSLTANSPMYIAFEDFADAVNKKNALKVASSLDLETVHTDRRKTGETAWGNLTQDQRQDWIDALTKELFEDKKWEIFWIFKAFGPDYSKDYAILEDATSMEFLVTMQPTLEKWSVQGSILTRVDYVDRIWKVARWDIRKDPRPPGWGKKKRRRRRYHDQLGRPEDRIITDVEGNKQKRDYIKPQPLEHLEDTPADLRAEIDRLIDVIMDPEELPKVFKPAMRRLFEVGKPAIPRLLTKFYEVKGTSENERMALRLIVDVLRDITGQSFGYTPTREATDDQRETALGFWFGWWTSNSFRTEFNPMDEEIPIPPFKKRGIRRTPKKPIK